MSQRYNPDRHHRHSLRLHGYDYTRAGAYFVTICTRNRECLFGQIIAGQMQFNAWGKIVEDEWLQTPTLRPGVELDDFVVMPNHFHAIVILLNKDARSASPQVPPVPELRRQPGSLGAVVGGFKSAVTRRIREREDNAEMVIWQSRFYEHIVRDEAELHRIRVYIDNNPAHWETDTENPASTSL